MDSLNLLRVMAPIAAVMLVPAIALLEPGVFATAIKLAYTQPAFGMLLLANSGLAYIVNYTNFRLTKVTSPLTLQVRDNSPQSSSDNLCAHVSASGKAHMYMHPKHILKGRQYSCMTVFKWDLQVLGCAKGVLATFVSLVLFGNQISRLGALGYAITVSGVLGYGLSKHRTLIAWSLLSASSTPWQPALTSN